MKVKITSCSCEDFYKEKSICQGGTEKFWYHDKIGQVFEANMVLSESNDEFDLKYQIDDNHSIIIKDCIRIEDYRESIINELLK